MRTLAIVVALLALVGCTTTPPECPECPSVDCASVPAEAVVDPEPTPKHVESPAEPHAGSAFRDLNKAVHETLRTAANPMRLQDKMRAMEALTLLRQFETSPKASGRRLCKALGNIHYSNKYKFECDTGHGLFGISYRGNVARTAILMTDGELCPAFVELGEKAKVLPPDEVADIRLILEHKYTELADALSFETVCVVGD